MFAVEHDIDAGLLQITQQKTRAALELFSIREQSHLDAALARVLQRPRDGLVGEVEGLYANSLLRAADRLGDDGGDIIARRKQNP